MAWSKGFGWCSTRHGVTEMPRLPSQRGPRHWLRARRSLDVMGDDDLNFPGESKGRMDDGNLCSPRRSFVPIETGCGVEASFLL